VLLDQLGALLLDDHGAGAEVRVVAVVGLLDDHLDRLGLDAGLSGVVDAAGQVAVGADLGGAEDVAKSHVCLPLVGGVSAVDVPGGFTAKPTPRGRPRHTNPFSCKVVALSRVPGRPPGRSIRRARSRPRPGGCPARSTTGRS